MLCNESISHESSHSEYIICNAIISLLIFEVNSSLLTNPQWDEILFGGTFLFWYTHSFYYVVFMKYSYLNPIPTKCQLISKGLFGVIVWTKKPTKFF